MSTPSRSPRLLSPDAQYSGGDAAAATPPSTYPITRTVAIIKTHALPHRFEIERRIQEASFEIVKERQMEFDTETDPDTLYELFGEDATSFSEGPVWVYVLERRRAVEVLNTLMGHPDPDTARADSPNSLRALFGISLQQNGLMGSTDIQIAELQIASLFASSPPFPTTDLPDDNHRYGSMRSVSSSVLEALRGATSDEGYAASSATNPSTVGGSSNVLLLTANGKPTFRARPVPATTVAPDIVPRMTRSAALRAGVTVDKTASGPRAPLSKEQLEKTFANVPGHKRAASIAVASTAAPTIAPRMTRAASLRLGVKPEMTTTRRKTLSSEEAVKATFEGVPGHKRRESIAVASVKAPTVTPRLNKSAALRQQKEQGPPSSFMFRPATTPKLPGLARSSSQSSLTPAKPAPTPAPAARPASQASQAPVSRYAIPRSSSVASQRPPVPSDSAQAKENGTTTTTTAKARPRPSSVASSAPSIAPRTNRSAALRAAKMEAEQAAAAASVKRSGRPKVAPSSFKPIAA
ncbi:Thioredoxin domain-containing protein 3 [Hypsizygus marmoreus]|uniref:Nucleoside diphosphate kinase n=1 Tax=Hypsizygus marmoreus TaxID=39966 RepID=A0A369JC57_HYPMA|nr:Thioredoxin domain-containing protein 3 [Hypsizygus marmoreus]